MLITVELKCTATHRWEVVARFMYSDLALTSARALSDLDGCTYRVMDNRWPEKSNESAEVAIFSNGKEI